MKEVALVIGASRGIGRQVAIDLAKNGYAVVVAAKSTSDASRVSPFPPDPNSNASTINTVEREIREAGGEATAIQVDTRDYESVKRLVDGTVAKYGRLDVLIYNSGAIWWSSIASTPYTRYRLMTSVNTDGLYAAVSLALPHFIRQNHTGRIVVISPPIYSRFFRGKTAYAMGKVAMSVLTKGLAMDFEREGWGGMAVSSIWPATAVESAATGQFTGKDLERLKDLRKPTIFSDAILTLLRTTPAKINGQLLLDEDILREHGGVTDFSSYSLIPGSTPRRIMPAEFPDLRVKEQDDEGNRVDSAKMRGEKSKI